MKTFIVLFRGINVGGRNILPMKELVALLKKNGGEDVRTYIQSGNVVLKCAQQPGAGIGKAIESNYGFRPELMVLEMRELEAAIRQNPFHAGEGKTIHFYFAGQKFVPDKKKLERYGSDSEQYRIQGNVFYLHAPDGIGRSKLVANIDSCLGVPVTGRNLNTISRLRDLANDA